MSSSLTERTSAFNPVLPGWGSAPNVLIPHGEDICFQSRFAGMGECSMSDTDAAALVRRFQSRFAGMGECSGSPSSGPRTPTAFNPVLPGWGSAPQPTQRRHTLCRATFNPVLPGWGSAPQQSSSRSRTTGALSIPFCRDGGVLLRGPLAYPATSAIFQSRFAGMGECSSFGFVCPELS